MVETIEEKWREDVAEMRERLFPSDRPVLMPTSVPPSGLTMSEERERKKREARLFWDDCFEREFSGKGRHAMA